MLNDTSVMNPKGHVKLELYNEDGVFFEKEKKNLVVTSANEIIAGMISNPARTSRVDQLDKGNTATTSNEEGTYTFSLSLQPEAVKTTTIDVVSVNEEVVFHVQDMKKVTELISVTVGAEQLVLNEDVFLKDSKEGVLEFAAAPKEQVTVVFQAVHNEQVKLIEGTEVVKVLGEVWKRANTPNGLNKTYAINYKTGEVYFEHLTTDIEVAYDCEKHYGLGFMGLGGKPEGHPDHQPVSFSQGDKALISLDGEFEGARSPILYPASIESGKPELEVLPTKPFAYDELVAVVVAADDDLDEAIDKVYQIDASGKKLLKLVSAKKLAPEGEEGVEDTPLEVGKDIVIKDAAEATIELTEAPAEGDRFEVVYQLRKNDLHLRYQLTTAPVVKLINVFYEDASGVSTPIALDIENNGMQIGSGQVWMMNANQGILQISSELEDTITQAGQLTVEYQVNSGTVVKFVADFPRGVPGPMKTANTDTFVSSGETTFILERTVAKDDNDQFEVLSVTRNGQPEQFTVHVDGARIDIENVALGDSVAVTYNFLKEEHEIYQVAMFDEKDPNNSKMFNISGIGPVTKDKNTGMRITWSVTF